MWFSLQQDSDTGFRVRISWLQGGTRGQPKWAFLRLTSVGCDPRQTRLQNLSVWLELVGRQESIGLFLQLRKGRQRTSGVTLCQGHTLCFGPTCTLSWLFRIPRPPLTVFPTMEELASHQIKLWGSPRGCQMNTILFVQQSYHPRAGCVTSPARAVL